MGRACRDDGDRLRMQHMSRNTWPPGFGGGKATVQSFLNDCGLPLIMVFQFTDCKLLLSSTHSHRPSLERRELQGSSQSPGDSPCSDVPGFWGGALDCGPSFCRPRGHSSVLLSGAQAAGLALACPSYVHSRRIQARTKQRPLSQIDTRRLSVPVSFRGKRRLSHSSITGEHAE